MIARIEAETLKTLGRQDVKAALERAGLEPMPEDSAQVTARIQRESGTWAGGIKEAGIRAE